MRAPVRPEPACPALARSGLPGLRGPWLVAGSLLALLTVPASPEALPPPSGDIACNALCAVWMRGKMPDIAALLRRGELDGWPAGSGGSDRRADDGSGAAPDLRPPRQRPGAVPRPARDGRDAAGPAWLAPPPHRAARRGARAAGIASAGDRRTEPVAPRRAATGGRRPQPKSMIGPHLVKLPPPAPATPGATASATFAPYVAPDLSAATRVPVEAGDHPPVRDDGMPAAVLRPAPGLSQREPSAAAGAPAIGRRGPTSPRAVSDAAAETLAPPRPAHDPAPPASAAPLDRPGSGRPAAFPDRTPAGPQAPLDLAPATPTGRSGEAPSARMLDRFSGPIRAGVVLGLLALLLSMTGVSVLPARRGRGEPD